MASDGHPPRSEKLIRCPRSLSGDLELMPAPDRPIYLDYNGTTPVAPEVLDAMLPFLRDQFGNASSTTPLGRTARAAIEEGRAEVAALIGAKPEEIVFTGGGTEASNHAIRGFAAVAPAGRRRIVTSMVEHPVTEMPCRRLEREGFSVSRIGVDADGIVDLAAARMAIDGETALVTIIHAQNEIGTLEPVAELAEAAREARAPIHVDASQSLGKVPVDVAVWGIDVLTLAGHKLYAPKGIGALYLRSGHAIPSVLDGAGQEGGRRPGTENVPYIVGLGRACRIARERLAEDAARGCRFEGAAMASSRRGRAWSEAPGRGTYLAEYAERALPRNGRQRPARGDARDRGFDRFGLPRRELETLGRHPCARHLARHGARCRPALARSFIRYRAGGCSGGRADRKPLKISRSIGEPYLPIDGSDGPRGTGSECGCRPSSRLPA